MFSSLFMRILNYVVALVSALLLLFNVSVPKDTEDTIDMSKLTLTFSDEFNGDTLDESVWHAHNSFGIRRGGNWSRDMLAVSDGVLHIYTQHLSDGEFSFSLFYLNNNCTDTLFML